MSLMLRTSVSKPVCRFYLGVVMYHMVAFFETYGREGGSRCKRQEDG